MDYADDGDLDQKIT